MNSASSSKRVRGPKVWCRPSSAFGKLGVEKREWLPPDGHDPIETAQFRAAVAQNAVAVYAREFKNGIAMRRTGLAALDNRLDAGDLWDARLNGHENLTMADLATLLTVLPDAVPDPTFIANFIAVAEGGPRPYEWAYNDTSSASV